MHKSLAKIIAAMLLTVIWSTATAQDIRYSWFEIGYVNQDIGRTGSLTDDLIGQTVDVSAEDGSGIKFRGSVGTWNNWFVFLDFSSSDIEVNALVSNSQGVFSAQDEFDFTTVSGGIGRKWSLTRKTDIYAAVSYDSADLDFGSFAGENFDVGDKDVGARIGMRSMVKDKVEIRASARYTNVGDVDLNIGALDAMDSDVLFGVGIGYELIRGLSITADYESGEFSSWNIGFRLDLDED